MSTDPIGIVLVVALAVAGIFVLIKAVQAFYAAFRAIKKVPQPLPAEDSPPRSSAKDSIRSARSVTATTNEHLEVASPIAVTDGGTSAAPTKTPSANEPGRIFICYRREDTPAEAGRLSEGLTQSFGEERVFFDIDSVPLAMNFVTYIADQLQQCPVMLVVIGRGWNTIADERGVRRLDDPADQVRVEIATALRLKVPVIPILVQNASMPRATDLPEDIRDLAFHNGTKLAPEFWREGVERLFRELDRLVGRPPSDLQPPARGTKPVRTV